MKALLYIAIFVFSVFTTSAQSDCDIANEIKDIFRVKREMYSGRAYLVKSVSEISTHSCFSELVNNNTQYLDYLLVNFSSHSSFDRFIAITDSLELQEEFIKSLETDSVFNSVLKVWTKKITDKENYLPDTISFNELLNVAIKYFSILGVNEQGHYRGKVCAGINGITQTEQHRLPQVEAFCFTTILNNYNGDEFNMYNEFVKGIKELYTMNLGVETEDLVLRAQGAMYMFMRNNEKLKELLVLEYERKKDILPFVLVE